MYAAPDGGSAIGPVQVAQIDSAAGHVLRTELTRILAVENDGSAAPKQLEIRLTERIHRLGIRVDESASRVELALTANYLLTPESGRPIRGSISETVVYDVPQQAFGEIAAQQDARERAAETLAPRIRSELAIRLAHARR